MICQFFADLTTAVFRAHEHRERPVRGHHDFYHAVRVGQMAYRISEEKRTARLAGAAGLCHNADRILQADLGLFEQEAPPEAKVMALLDTWLCCEERISVSERRIITQAVMRHTRPNENTDDPVTVALKDADRLVNVGADNLLRLGQFYPGMLTVDLRNPLGDREATFRQPGSVLQAIQFQMEWTEQGGKFGVRLPRSREIAVRRRRLYERFVREEIGQLEEEGLYPLPDDVPRIDPWK